MWVHNLNPIAVSLGSFDIRWYGIMYALTFLIVYFYLQKRVKKEEIKLSSEQIDTIMIWATVGLVFGARIFEILFWGLDYYLSNPLDVFKIWQGGLSFHGGLFGIIFVAVVLFKKYKLNFLEMADIFVVPLALGQALGRVGNFFNGELYGRITDVAWAVQFPGVSGWRHPSQVYEIIYDLFIFGVLFSLRNKKIVRGWPHGMLLVLFLLMYPVFRFITEFFRDASSYVGVLTMGQFLNIFMFLGGIGLFYYIRKNRSDEKTD